MCGCRGILEDRFPHSRFRTHSPQVLALIFIRTIQRLCFQRCLHKHYKTVDGFLPLSRQSRSFRHQSFGETTSINITENSQGVVLMAVASIIWNFVKSKLLRVHDVYLLGLLTIFNN